MEIPRHVGDYKEFLLMPIGKERRKGKAQSYKKKKILTQVLWNCFLSEIQFKITN